MTFNTLASGWVILFTAGQIRILGQRLAALTKEDGAHD